MDCPQRSFNPNKHLKEQFVSNLTGSSMLEISALLTTVPIIFMWHSICFQALNDADPNEASLKEKNSAMVASKNLKAFLATLVMDFVFIVLPTLFLFTVLAEWICPWTILLCLLLIVSIAVNRYCCIPYSEGPNSIRSSISSYRVAMMLVTCLCILAVDFRIFPREFAKTETYDGPWGWLLRASEFNCFTASTKCLIVNVRIGEYGVHWNFFFTLADVSILTSTVNVPPKYSGILRSVILVGYQIWLTNGLNVYLLSNKRGMDMICRSKEGIFSIFGYLGMNLIGVRVGYYLFFVNHSSGMLRSNNGTRTRVWLASIFFWFLTLLLDRYVERISCRMCNLAYVTWVLPQNLQLLAILMLSDYVPRSNISALEKAFDRNLLASFLLANVFTVLVNLSVDTLFASSVSALSIHIVYSLTCPLSLES